jgi:rhamnose utilization protein RhaD (predicted bifunctional aldolase and dehydrogenase)
MRTKDISSEQFELTAVRELSAAIGREPLLVQASSGNTSIKIGDVLWIKASGKWLIQADSDDFLVSVQLSRARRCLRDDTAIPETASESSVGLRASIETAMHAVLPQKVVVHVHSINAIAWAVREDGPRQLGLRLSGLPWRWIPYTPSGSSLARMIERVLSRFPLTDVLVLGNHGLVVCGDTCRLAEQLLAEVEKRLAIEPRSAPEPHSALLNQVLSESAWSLPPYPAVHSLATDRLSRRILSGGVLYPCQAIFLPGTTPVLASPASQQAFQLFEDRGVLCGNHMTRAEQQMLAGLANVVQRIDASAPLRYLTSSEVSDVLNGGAESYRQVAGTNCRSAAMTMGW